MAASKEPHRLILFTDAVVAIAITLLVLPLVDIVPEVAKEHGEAIEVITKHQPEIWTFLLSFVVIIRFWFAHHRAYQHVRAYSTPLILCNAGWLLAIVVLPFPTEAVGVFHSDRFTTGFYIGTILAVSAFQTAMTLIIGADAEVASEENPPTPELAISSVTATLLLAAALIVALALPAISYWALLLLLLSTPVEQALRRRQRVGTEA